MGDKKQQVIELEQRLTRELQPDPNVGEKAHFTSLCNLRVKNDQNEYDNIGGGMVQILQNNTNQRYRLLIRDSHDLNRPLLNCYILPFGNLREFKDNPNQYQFDAIDYGETVSRKTYFIKINNLLNKDAGTQFRQKYIQAFETNRQILTRLKL